MVELLVAGFVLVVVLGAASVFFSQQVRLNRDVQARNELQDRVRVAVQLVTQDLALAGNPVLITPDGRVDGTAVFPGCFAGSNSCVEIGNVSPASSTLMMRYISSQFVAANACRDVGYRVEGGVLQRSDVACGSGSDWIELAPEVLGFKMILICSSGTRFDAFPPSPATDCAPPASYARSAVFSIGAASSRTPRPGSPATRFVTVTPGAFTDVPCPEGNICFDATAEVLMPNLKDR